MAELYDELLDKGFAPVLNFKNDGYTKILHIENFGTDVRLSELGQVTIPKVTLTRQNKTLKTIAGGTRVHLSVSTATEPPIEVPTPPISCAGATISGIVGLVWNSKDIIDIVGSSLDDVTIEVNGKAFRQTLNTPEGTTYGAIGMLATREDFQEEMSRYSCGVYVDSYPSIGFDGWNITTDIRVSIIPHSEVALKQLTLISSGVPDSWGYNPTAQQDPVTGIISFCLSPQSQLG